MVAVGAGSDCPIQGHVAPPCQDAGRDRRSAGRIRRRDPTRSRAAGGVAFKLRYFRLSQITDDLADAYRNRRLALESLLDEIHPKTSAETTKRPTLMVRSDRKGTAMRRSVVLIAILAALTAACSSSHAAGAPESIAAPTPASVSPVVVLVHGFSPNPEGYGCAD